MKVWRGQLHTQALSLRATEGSAAIRHEVSLRGTFAESTLSEANVLSIDSAEAIYLRFLAQFTLSTFVSLSAGSANALGMTFQVRLLQSLRSFAMTPHLMRVY